MYFIMQVEELTADLGELSLCSQVTVRLRGVNQDGVKGPPAVHMLTTENGGNIVLYWHLGF